MPRCYMVKKDKGDEILPYNGPDPNNAMEASVAPPCYNPAEDAAKIEPESARYAEPEIMPVVERSAEETEAALELLSLAQGLRPPPPANVFNVPQPPQPPIVPVYTFTIQPSNIIFINGPPKPIMVTPTIAPPPQVKCTEPQVSYLAYQPNPEPPIQYLEVVPLSTSIAVPMPITVPITMPIIQTLTLPPSSKPEEPPKSLGEPAKPAMITPPLGPKLKPYSYDCNECGKCYATSSNLSRHKQTHRSLDSNDAKRCDYCGKVYVSMPALAMHLLTHKMSYVCDKCGKQFSRPWLLRGHLRSHTGEKPYDCPVSDCCKAFADRSNLRAHLQTHSFHKQYQCPRCHKSFALKSYLTKHAEGSCQPCGHLCEQRRR